MITIWTVSYTHLDVYKRQVLGAPLFRKATLHFENGKSLTIDAPDNSPENMYIESLKVNGVDSVSYTHLVSTLRKQVTIPREESASV